MSTPCYPAPWWGVWATPMTKARKRGGFCSLNLKIYLLCRGWTRVNEERETVKKQKAYRYGMNWSLGGGGRLKN